MAVEKTTTIVTGCGGDPEPRRSFKFCHAGGRPQKYCNNLYWAATVAVDCKSIQVSFLAEHRYNVAIFLGSAR